MNKKHNEHQFTFHFSHFTFWEAQMRISTTALMKSALLLVAVLALVPQFAFAQLPVETRELKLQGATSGSLILKTPATTTNYVLAFPDAITGTQGPGTLMFISSAVGSTNGTLAFSNAPTASGYVPRWNGSAVEWIDPTGSANPNWSLSGNTLTGDGTLGVKNGFAINIKTDDKVRMVVASDGAITINTDATDGGATTTVGRSAGHTTNVNGTVNALGTTNVNTSGTAATTVGNNTANVTVDADNLTVKGKTAINVTGPTNINTTGTSGTTIGNAAANVTVNADTYAVTAATAATITGATTVTGVTTVVGTTNINNTGTATTSIGTASGAGTTTIGRSDGTTTVVGNATINNDVNNTTSINAGTSTGAVTIGGSAAQTISIGNGAAAKTVNLGSSTGASATTILGGSGGVKINNTGTAQTDIGNSDGGTSITGPLEMEGAAGTSGNVLVSQGSTATPQWQNLNNAIGIRKVGVEAISGTSVTVSNIILQTGDAVIITLAGSASAVVPTITTRTNSTNATTANGSFVVTLSASYTGDLNYMVIRGQ